MLLLSLLCHCCLCIIAGVIGIDIDDIVDAMTDHNAKSMLLSLSFILVVDLSSLGSLIGFVIVNNKIFFLVKSFFPHTRNEVPPEKEHGIMLSQW